MSFSYVAVGFNTVGSDYCRQYRLYHETDKCNYSKLYERYITFESAYGSIRG